MGLINCPECHKEISDTCETCVHCGCPIVKKVRYNIKIKKIIFVLVLLVVLVVGFFCLKNIGNLLPHTIKNGTLIKIMDYTNPTDIHDELGYAYENMVWDSLGSTTDVYNNVIIDGKAYAQVELEYQLNGVYKRIYLDSNPIWTEDECTILVHDLIEQYGNEYDYEKTDHDGRTIYRYSWEFTLDRRISLSIYQSRENENLYWVKINSFHN